MSTGILITFAVLGVCIFSIYFLIQRIVAFINKAALESDQQLNDSEYLRDGCAPYRKGVKAWLWRCLQCGIRRKHYVPPQQTVARFIATYPTIIPGAYVKTKQDAVYYPLLKPGSIVCIARIDMDERILSDPETPRLLEPLVWCFSCDKRGYVMLEAPLSIWVRDLEPLSREELAYIEKTYAEPIEELPAFKDGQIVETIPDILYLQVQSGAFGSTSINSWKIAEPLRGIIDIADSQSGGSVNSINKAKLKPEVVEYDCTWCVYNFATRGIYEKTTKHVAVRRALRGPEYQVFFTRNKIHLKFDRAVLREREYDRNMINRVVLDERVRQKLLAWAPPTKSAKEQLAKWGVGSGLLSGKSNIMMFIGPLGSGKTLSAEALAEYLEMPFYPFDSNEFGTSPEQLERGLKEVGGRAKRWGALVFWDEAEENMKMRQDGNDYSNSRVAVTLRYLESFEGGVLVIGTNRPFVVDEGINSRIPVKIMFPGLDGKRREAVWRAHLPQNMPLDPTEPTSQDWRELSSIKLDGRQVRNAVLLAARRAAREEKNAVPFLYLKEAAHEVRADSESVRKNPMEWDKPKLGYSHE